MNEFIYERDKNVKEKIFFLLGLSVVVIILFVTLLPNLSSVDFKQSIISPPKILLIAAIGGLFFIPIPQEVVFIIGLRQGSDPYFLLLAAISGIFLGHLVSYLIGLKLSGLFRFVTPAKKMYSLRRSVLRYGGFAVLLVNILPAPAPILTFALGIVRYNIYRLFSLLVLGALIKFSTIIIFYNISFF